MLTPRPYQLRLVESCREAFGRGHRAVLAVLPTGGGKTVIGALVVEGALARGRRVLWLAGRRELIDQAAKRLPGRVGVLMAGRTPDLEAPVLVASIDTIESWRALPPADLIVYDEAHHVVASTSRDLLGRYPHARVLGLTATPCRSDGTALGDIFQELIQGPSVRDLIEEGHLVECDAVIPEDKGEGLASDPLTAWQSYADGRPGFVFCRTIEQSRGLVERFNRAGILAAHVDGGTAKGVRDEAIAKFRRGAIDVLSSVQVFTEGVDVPRASVCLLARGCGNAGTYLQMVGRVLRPAPGKSRAILIDLYGIVHEHGFPDDYRPWSLFGKPSRLMSDAPPVAQCPRCGCAWRASPERRTCPRCGWERPPVEEPAVLERELRPVDVERRAEIQRILSKLIRPEVRAARYAELLETARARGYNAGWAVHRYRAQYGSTPAEDGIGGVTT